MHSYVPRPPVVLDAVLSDPGLVRRLAEENAPYAPVQRYVQNAEEQRVLSQRPAQEKPAPLYVAPIFRGDWAYDAPLVHGVEPLLESESLADAAREVFDGAIVRPQIVYANFMLPIPDYDLGHTDVPAFRGVDRTRYPVWLLTVMGRSGLFERWRVRIATAVSWWYEGEGGSFTYWPDGPDAASRTVPPTPNTAVVGDNDFMFHRADGVGPSGTRFMKGLSLDSQLVWKGGDEWAAVDGDRELLALPWRDIRLSVSWKAQVFRDEDEVRLVEEHADDLSLDQAVEALLADLAERGRTVERPADPLRDTAFMTAVGEAYGRTPTAP